MALVNTLGPVITPYVLLPGKTANFRKPSNRKFETQSFLLPVPNFLFMRTVKEVDANICTCIDVTITTSRNLLRLSTTYLIQLILAV